LVLGSRLFDMSENKLKFCTNCGEQLNKDKAFCTSCGKALAADKSAPPKEEVSEVKAPEATPQQVIEEPPLELPKNVEGDKHAPEVKPQEDKQEDLPKAEGKDNTLLKTFGVAVLGVFVAIALLIGIGLAMPDSSLGRAVAGLFSEEEVYVPEEIAYEPVFEEPAEDYSSLAQNYLDEDANDATYLFRETYLEIREIGDPGHGSIGRIASLFNEFDGTTTNPMREEMSHISLELDALGGRVRAISSDNEIARANQLRLIELSRIRLYAIFDAGMHMPQSAEWSRHLDLGREARIEYEQIIEAGDLY
jgi:hypothetical protein